MASATDIFNKLIKDPDYIGKEDEARREAEYRARQHFNNMMALSLANDENAAIKTSAISSLSNFLGRAITIMKDMAYYNDMSFAYKDQLNKVVGLNDIVKLPEHMQKFIGHLEASGMPLESVKKIAAKAEDAHKADPDVGEAWVNKMAAAIASSPKLHNALKLSPLMVKNLNSYMKDQGYKLPKTFIPPTIQANMKTFYGKNKGAELEASASIDRVNAALKKAGRKESIEFGASNKLKVTGGNSDQWNNFWPGKSQGRMYHSMIEGNNPDTSMDETEASIKPNDITNYTVAQILHGMHHFINHDGGRYDITPQQHQDKLAKTAAELESKHQQIQHEQEQLATNPELENDSLPQTEEEAKQVYSNPSNLDSEIPHHLFGSSHDNPMNWPHIQSGVAHGLCNENGVLTPLGNSLMLHAKSDGWGHKDHIYHHKAANAHVINADGLDDIIKKYALKPGIDQDTQGYLNEQIIKDAIGDYFPDSLEEAVEKQNQVVEDGDIQPNPAWADTSGTGAETKKLQAWDDIHNNAQGYVANEILGGDSSEYASKLDYSLSQLKEANDELGMDVSTGVQGKAIQEHILDNVPDEHHLPLMDKLVGMSSPYISDSQLGQAIDHFNSTLMTLQDAHDEGANAGVTMEEAVNDVHDAMHFLGNPHGVKVHPQAFKAKLKEHAPSMSDFIANDTKSVSHQLQQVLDTHPASKDAHGSNLLYADKDEYDDYQAHKANQEATPGTYSEAKEQEVEQKKANLFDKVQDVLVNDHHTDGSNPEKFQETVDDLHTSMADLQNSGVPASEIKETVLEHTNSIGGSGQEELENLGVNFPTDEPDSNQTAAASEEDTVTQPEAQQVEQTPMSDEPTNEELLDPNVADSPTPTDFQTTPATSSEEEEPATPAAPSEADVQAKHNAKKDKVMSAVFGDNQDHEDAQLYSEWLDENPKEVASAYKQHVIGGVLNKVKEQQKNAEKEEAEQAKQAEEQSQQEAAEATAQSEDEKKQAVEEANTLPHKPGDLDKLAKEDDFSPVTATHHARELLAHKNKHEDNMKASSKQSMKKSLMEAEKHGADFDKLSAEMDKHGDDFGSQEHMQQSAIDDMLEHDKHANYKDLLTSLDGDKIAARADSFHEGQYNKFTHFNEDGTPSHDVHVAKDKTGRANSLDHSKNRETLHGDENAKEKFHTETGKALGTHHSLESMSKEQKVWANNYKAATATGDDETAGKMLDKLEASGIQDMSSITGEHHEDETPKTGPPDPEVARQKMAEGYVWHEQTRHWIKKESLEDMKGSNGGNDASIISAGHGGDEEGGGSFALNEDGSASDKNFLYHGSGNLMGIGSTDAKPGKSGFASHNDVVENSLAHSLTETGHLQDHDGVTKIKDFSSDTSFKGNKLGKRTGFNAGGKHEKNPKSNIIPKPIQGLKGFKADAIQAFKTGKTQGFGGGGGSEPVEKSLAAFIKAYAPEDSHLHRKKKVEEILEKESIIH